MCVYVCERIPFDEIMTHRTIRGLSTFLQNKKKTIKSWQNERISQTHKMKIMQMSYDIK